MGVAGEPAHPLQPRVGRPGREPVVGAQEATSGGTARKWTGLDVPDFEEDEAARLRAARRREGAGRHRRRPPVHHAGGRTRAGSSSRRGSRTGRSRRTTSRTSRRSTTRSTRSARTRAASRTRTLAEDPYNPVADEPGAEIYPVRRDDLPADRAPHGRRDVALRAVPRRAAARDVLRGLAGARGRGRARARRLGDDLHVALGDRGARARHRPHAAARRCTAATTHQVGLPYHWGSALLDDRRQRERPHAHGARPERAHPGGQGVHVRDPARPPAAREGAAAFVAELREQAHRGASRTRAIEPEEARKTA